MGLKVLCLERICYKEAIYKMSKTRFAYQSLITATIVLACCFCAKNMAAQNGSCVVNTQQISIPCQGGCGPSGCTCHGNITITMPNGGYGTGVLYGTIDAWCCSTKFSTLGTPDGQCRVMASVPQTQPSENRLVF